MLNSIFSNNIFIKCLIFFLNQTDREIEETFNNYKTLKYRECNILTVGFAIAAIDGPIIIAMIMDCTVSIEQKSVLTVFEGQSAVRAQEESPAVLRMSVSMDPVGIGAWRSIE